MREPQCCSIVTYRMFLASGEPHRFLERCIGRANHVGQHHTKLKRWKDKDAAGMFVDPAGEMNYNEVAIPLGDPTMPVFDPPKLASFVKGTENA